MCKSLLRFCSLILVLVMLVNMLPMQSFAADYRASLAEEALAELSEDTQVQLQQDKDTYVLGEITENRTEYSKEFLLSNGLHLAAVYPDAVHYETEDGWEEIDNTLKATRGGTYTNTAGVWQVSFPQQLTGEKSVSVTKDGYTLSFAMAGEIRLGGAAVKASLAAQETLAVTAMKASTATIREADTAARKASLQFAEAEPDKLYSRLAYEDVYTDTDILYDLDSNRLKESVVLNRYSETLRGYRYTLNVGQMIPVLDETGQITLYAPDGETVVMVMPAPFLMDANSEYNSDIQVSLTGSGSTYTLTYLLPQQWLADADRAWPVILDPVLNADTKIVNIIDRRISEYTTWPYNHHLLEAGYYHSDGKTRSYLRFDGLPSLSSSDVVVSASVHLYQPTTRSNPSMQFCVEVHKVTQDWTSHGITWAGQPSFDPIVEDYCMVRGTPDYYTWDVTDAARSWYADGNYGLVFKSTDANENAGADNWMQFCSSEYDDGIAATPPRPLLFIQFRNNNGLESYWDYTSTSAGRAGTGYINNFTGNLVWVHDTIGFGGNRMPVSITHVYNANDIANHDVNHTTDNNSNDTAGNFFGMGTGWRTNFHQRLHYWNLSSEIVGSYYFWEDADGTDHYFKAGEDGVLRDEDGLELKLTTNGSGTQKYCIEDKYGNKSFFDEHGRLTKQQNNQQTPSSINITYTTATGPLISTITDGAGRAYVFGYETDEDIGVTYLSYIRYNGTGTTAVTQTNFYYDLYANGKCQLISIEDADEQWCEFGYDSKGLLIQARDVGGYRLTYAYNTAVDDWQPRRVVQVCEYDSTEPGGELNIEYAHNQTTFTDHDGNVEIMHFNNFGNTISIQDDEGHAQYAQYALNTDIEAKKNTDPKKKVHQLRLSSKLQNTVGNLLKDSSFENGNIWHAYPENVVTREISTAQAYMGNKSMRLTVSPSATSWACLYSDNFTMEANATYTYSAYVKGVTGNAYLLVANRYDSGGVSTHAVSGSTDWKRVELTYTNPYNFAINASVQLFCDPGSSAYIDCVQVEKAPTASRYNLIENGDFRYGTQGWSLDSLTGTDGVVTASHPTFATELDNSVVQLTGNPNTVKHVYQRVQVSGKAGDTFILSGWAKGDSVPIVEGSGRDMGLYLCFNYKDGSYKDFTFHFNPDEDSQGNWQYGSWVAVAEQDYSSINIDIRYDYNMNTAWFDGIQLYKEEFGQSYAYDEDGNITSVTDLQGQISEYEYTSNNLTKEMLPSGVELTYTYDNWHNVKTATTQKGLVYEFEYDTYGNNTEVSITADAQTMTSTAVYSSDGNRLVSTTDALGKITTYGYNADTNVLEWVQYPEDTDGTDGTPDTRTKYTYDQMYRLSGVSSLLDTGKTLGVSYTYNEDRLEEIWAGGDTLYLVYNDFDQIDWIGTDFLDLAGYYYTDDRNHYLEKLDYCNGTSVEYTYDDKGRVVKETYEDEDTVTYTYDNDGALATMTDSATGRTTKYYYDFIGRTMKQVETGTNYSHSVSYGYDQINNLISMVETINGVTNTTNYTYDEDNRIESVTNGESSAHYSYDSFGRLTGEISKHEGEDIVTQTPTYYAPSANATSGQVATYQVTSDGYNKTFSYTYDDNGNITAISDGTNTTSYAYDSANQLIRENNQGANKTWTWEYDNIGNILCKKEYAYTTGALGTPLDTIQYGYDLMEWGQLLSSYDGNGVGYGYEGDVSNSVVYDDKYEYTWEHGHQLQRLHQMTVEDNFREHTFAYDANGMRTTRQIWDDYGSELTGSYEYIYNGSLLTRMTYSGTDGRYTMDFRYDANGTPLSVHFTHYVYEFEGVHYGEENPFTCCNATFYYITNLQGDVVAIVDYFGYLAATYTYDAWGRPLSTQAYECIGDFNPLRYRGYVYDTETGFYYLQSRYYDPVKGRFISPDSIDVLTATPMGLTDKNLFAYCDNNPVVRVDRGGRFWETIFDVISLGASIVEVCVNPKDPWAWAGLVGDTIDLVPFLAGVGEAMRAVKTIDKVADTVQIAKAVDFTDDAADLVKTLDRSSGYTKSTARTGRKIHNGYKVGDGFNLDWKEYKDIKGIRPDYVDFDNKIIYELKPMNPRSARSGIRQLQKYNKALGGGFTMRLELY